MSKWIWTVIACVAVGAVAFFGGVFVGRATAPSGFNRAGFGALGGQNADRGGGFAAGKVIKSDSGSLTLQLSDGSGTKNVIVDSTTRIIKSEVVSDTAISVGTTVTAIGTAGSDGSITARAVTIGEGLGGLRGIIGGGARPGGQNGQGGGANGGQGGGANGGQGGQGGGGFGGPPPGQ